MRFAEAPHAASFPGHMCVHTDKVELEVVACPANAAVTTPKATATRSDARERSFKIKCIIFTQIRAAKTNYDFKYLDER